MNKPENGRGHPRDAAFLKNRFSVHPFHRCRFIRLRNPTSGFIARVGRARRRWM